MYLEHYGLREPPFSITPDPRFVFLSERHRDALAHLLFGVGQGGGGGFVQLTGEVGTGKTTLSRLLLEQLPDHTRVALVLNPRLSAAELLETVCQELRLDVAGARGSVKALTDILNTYLLEAYAQCLRVVLIIDEAQNLSIDALEQVRLLTNLETHTQKLLQIILLGQPELRETLAQPELRQLAQRITARFHLTPLDAEETANYVRHRYGVAGGLHLPFDTAAIKRIHVHSGGVPRLINVIAERALLGGYAQDQTRIDARTVDRAAREALAPRPSRWPRRRWLSLVAGVVAGGAALVMFAAMHDWRAPPAVSTPARAIARMLIAPVGTLPGARSEKRLDTRVPATHPGAATPPVNWLDAEAFAARFATPETAPAHAWKRMLELWALPADEATIVAAARCPFAIAPDTYCLRARGHLDRLVAQDRPVLLRLRGGERDAWAVLLGADARRVRLSLEGTTVDIDRITLSRHWNGEYAALWRGPTDLAYPLADGSPTAVWVRDHLAPRYLSADAPPVFDGTMQTAVRRFQADRGLASDGVVGPETLMALAAREPGGPRLQTELE